MEGPDQGAPQRERKRRRILLREQDSDYVREQLGTANPAAFIAEFQANNGLHSDLCLPTLPLLDLHAFPRARLYQSLLETLRNTLLARLEALPAEQIGKLLKKTFPFILDPELSGVALAVLEHHPEIPAPYLRKLWSTPALYDACSLPIKRQIWLSNKRLLNDTIRPLLLAYADRAALAYSRLDVKRRAAVQPEARRKDEAVQQLADIIGSSVELYNRFLMELRARFASTGDLSYCSLRTDVLMALHDREVVAVYGYDPCHKFAWCLSACTRDGKVDLKRASDLKAFLDAQKANSPLVGEIAMVAADPYATASLARCAFRRLETVVQETRLPSSDPTLVTIAQLLRVGRDAHTMVASRRFMAPEAALQAVREEHPALALLLVQARLAAERRAQKRRAARLEADPAPAADEALEPLAVPAALTKLITTNANVHRIVLLFCLEQAYRHQNLRPVLGLFPVCFKDGAASVKFLCTPEIASLVAVFRQQARYIGLHERVAVTILDGLASVAAHSVRTHVLLVTLLIDVARQTSSATTGNWLSSAIRTACASGLTPTEADSPGHAELLAVYERLVAACAEVSAKDIVRAKLAAMAPAPPPEPSPRAASPAASPPAASPQTTPPAASPLSPTVGSDAIDSERPENGHGAPPAPTPGSDGHADSPTPLDASPSYQGTEDYNGPPQSPPGADSPPAYDGDPEAMDDDGGELGLDDSEYHGGDVPSPPM